MQEHVLERRMLSGKTTLELAHTPGTAGQVYGGCQGAK